MTFYLYLASIFHPYSHIRLSFFHMSLILVIPSTSSTSYQHFLHILHIIICFPSIPFISVSLFPPISLIHSPFIFLLVITTRGTITKGSYMLWKSTCLLFRHVLVFAPSFPFHTFFPTIISFHFPILGMGNLYSLEAWSLVPHYLIPYSFHHSFHPFIIPPYPTFSSIFHSLVVPCHWSPSIISCLLSYQIQSKSSTFIHFYPFYPSFHIKFNPSLPIHSMNSFLL